MAKTPIEEDRTVEETEIYFTQPADAIELVRTEPSDAEIAARLDAGETLDDIAASMAIAEMVEGGSTIAE